ncbi:MAG: hypothetical protein ACLT3Y_00245 [Ruminococcus callidus]
MAKIATVALKQNEPAILALCEKYRIPLETSWMMRFWDAIIPLPHRRLCSRSRGCRLFRRHRRIWHPAAAKC